MKKLTTTILLLLLALGVSSIRTYADFDEESSTIEFYGENLYSDVWALKSDDNNIPKYTTSMSLEFPTSTYHRFSWGGIASTITFYDEGDEELETIEFVVLKSHEIGGVYFFDFEGFGIAEARSFNILIVQSFSTFPTGVDYTGYMGDNIVAFDETIKTLIAYDRLTIYTQRTFVRVPPDIGSPSFSGLQFNGWKLANGDLYDFGPVTDDMLSEGDTLIIYASWTDIIDFDYELPGGDTVPDGPVAIARFLTLFGLYNFPGLMLLYVLLLVVLFGVLTLARAPGITYPIVTIALTALFMYVNFIPTFAYIIILGFSIVVLISQVSSSNVGGVSRE